MPRFSSMVLGAALLAAPVVQARAQSANPADVTFMQGMIEHHAQAVTMSALVATRTTHPQLRLLAERITVSQQDEIAIMRRWLEERRLPIPAAATPGAVPPTHDAHASHGAAGAHEMPGMLSSAQMDSLSAASGTEFDRRFLRFMIQHHDGALVMVAQLLAAPNAARDSMIFQFASDVDTDQRAEIRRMRALLASLPSHLPSPTPSPTR